MNNEIIIPIDDTVRIAYINYSQSQIKDDPDFWDVVIQRPNRFGEWHRVDGLGVHPNMLPKLIAALSRLERLLMLK